MKKLIALLLALVMVIGLASCGQPAGSNTPDGGAPSSTEPDGPGESGQPEGATPLAGKHIGLMIYSTTTPWAMNIIDTIQSLCDSLGMQLTVAQYFTPNGNEVHHKGITPDVIAEMPEENKDVMYDIGDMNDPQLKIAYDVAVEKLP